MAATGLPRWPWLDVEPAALPAAERLLADALRAWRNAASNGAPPCPALRILLAAEGAERAAPALDALLRLASDAVIGHPLRPGLTADEAGLLLLCALAQRGARHEAMAAALRLLPLRPAQVALSAAIAIGAELRAAGLLLRHPLRDALRSAAPPRG